MKKQFRNTGRKFSSGAAWSIQEQGKTKCIITGTAATLLEETSKSQPEVTNVTLLKSSTMSQSTNTSLSDRRVLTVMLTYR